MQIVALNWLALQVFRYALYVSLLVIHNAFSNIRSIECFSCDWRVPCYIDTQKNGTGSSLYLPSSRTAELCIDYLHLRPSS